MSDLRCDCGARMEAIDVTHFGEVDRQFFPGPHIDPCTCPTCVSCGHRLLPGPHPVCPNPDCALYDVWQLIPDGAEP